MACCYLIERGDDLAFIEAGTAHGVPRLMALLDARGLERERVRYVIPTHVHLDHAGGAGVLMRALPNATLGGQERGARALIDPAKPIDGAAAVYGDDVGERDASVMAWAPRGRAGCPQAGAMVGVEA